MKKLITVLIIDRDAIRGEATARAFEIDSNNIVSRVTYSSTASDPDLEGIQFDLVLRHGSDEYPNSRIEKEARFKVCYGGHEGVHPGMRPGEENIYRVIWGDQFLTPEEAKSLLKYAMGDLDIRPTLLNPVSFDQDLEEKLDLLQFLTTWLEWVPGAPLPQKYQRYNSLWRDIQNSMVKSNEYSKKNLLQAFSENLLSQSIDEQNTNYLG